MKAIRRYSLGMLLLAIFAGVAAAVLLFDKMSISPPAWFAAVEKHANPGVEPLVHQTDAKAREVERRFKESVVMLHAKQYEHALTALHRVLELAPTMPEAHVNMGYTMLGLMRFAAARDFFSGAIELRPMQANAYYGLALALDAQNDRARALGAMRSFVHLARPDDPFVRKARAALWEWQSGGVQNNDVGPSAPPGDRDVARAASNNAK